MLAAALTLLREMWWVALRCLGQWRGTRKTRRSVAGNCSGGYANGCGFRMVVGSDALAGGAIHGRRC